MTCIYPFLSISFHYWLFLTITNKSPKHTLRLKSPPKKEKKIKHEVIFAQCSLVKDQVDQARNWKTKQLRKWTPQYLMIWMEKKSTEAYYIYPPTPNLFFKYLVPISSLYISVTLQGHLHHQNSTAATTIKPCYSANHLQY